jgi:DNA invertase Pin-like site-specific DNA recombinase
LLRFLRREARRDVDVQIFSYRQGVDTSTPMGAMLWQFLGIFAEFEHGIRRERQAIGIAKAKERGVRFGRPPVSSKRRREIIAMRHQGMAINKIARGLGVGTGPLCTRCWPQVWARRSQHLANLQGNFCGVRFW